MNRAKRLLALLLVLATVLSIFPLQSLAAEVEEDPQEPETAETAELYAEEEPEEPSGDEAEVPAEEKPENFAEDQVETPIEKESEPEEGPADSSAPARQPARISSGAEVVADGISGDVSWTLYDDGTLVIGETITGSGKMADYPRSNARPWWRIDNVVYLQLITSVVVKEGVTSIGDYAFFYMQNLSNVELPDSITSIGDSAFGTCKSLTGMVIPDAVTSIGANAFNYATSLTDLVIPEGVKSIGKDAFKDTPWQKSQGDLVIVNGILVDYQGEGGSVTIPNTVTAINEYAFQSCNGVYEKSNVTEVIIPDSIEQIGKGVFYDCWNLKSVTLPSSMTEIPDQMFFNCFALTAVTFPEGITTIGKSAFSSCRSLTRIELPDGVTTIGNDAFSWCESLTQITIPASVTKIGGDAFDKVSKDLVIIGAVDSYAQQFATDRGFQFHGIMPLGSVELSKTVYTYSGEPCTPDATVRDSEGNLLEEGVDYVVTYSDNIDAGTATATVTGIGPYRGTITATYSIQSAAQVLVVTPSAVTVGMGETVQLNVTGFGTLHFSINQPNVATVGANGLVKGLTVGSAVITVKADGDRNHRAAATTVPVTVVLATPQITGVISQNNGVQISWNAVPGAAKYRVFHRTGTGNWQGLGITTALTFTDTTAVSGAKYDYTVRCVSADEKTYTSSFDPVGKTITYIATPVLRSVENVRGGVQISWNAVPGAAKYRVFHKTGTGNWQGLGITTGLTFTDTTAVSGVKYDYTVRCVSADEKTYTSSFDPVGKTITYIATPVLRSVENVRGGVQISWNAVPGAAKYRVFHRTGAGDWQRVGITTGLTFTDTTAVSGVKYDYTVRCVSADEKTYTSSFDPVGKTITYIATPVLRSVENVRGGVQISWNAVPGAAKYRVFHKTGTGNWQGLGITTGLTFTDTTAVSGVKYDYTVRCVSADEKTYTSSFDPVGKTITYIATPVLAAPQNAVNGGVQITWSKVPGAAKYRVFRKNSSGGWDRVGITTGLTLVDTEALNGVTYTYTVRCVSADEKVYTSSFDPVGKTITCVIVPALRTVQNTPTGVQITWEKINGAAKYRVFHRTGTGDWQRVGITTGLTFTDTTAVSGVKYDYTVRCVSADEKTYTSSFDPVGKTITYIATPVLRSVENVRGGVQISWNAVPGAAKYRVFHKTGTGNWQGLGITTGLTFTDTTAVSGVKYDYTVRCVSADEKTYTSSFDPVGKTITYIATPVLAAPQNAVNGGVQITWSKVPGAVKYRVFRKNSSGGWDRVGITTGLTLVDTEALNGVTYTYTVRCVSADEKVYTSSFDPVGKTITCVIVPALRTVQNTPTGVQITWEKINGAAKYRVFHRTGTGDWQRVGITTGLTFTDTTAVSGVKYDYTVRCVSADEKTYTSSFDPVGKTITYIATPVLRSVENVRGGVQISWNAVPGAAKYRVFHKTGTGNWQGLGITTGLTFTDTTAVSGVKYDYTVRCVSADEKTYTSSFDPVGKTITYIATPVLAEPENVAGGVQVTWGKVDGAAKYRLYRKNSSGGWTSVGDTTGLSLVDTKVPRGSEQTYTVRCVSSDGKTHTSSFDPVGKSIFVPLYTAPNSYSFSVAYRTGVYYNRLMSVKVGSDQRQAILDVAQSQLGYTEGNNKNAIGGNASGSQNYTEFGLWYYNNIDSSDQFYLGAWCSMFVSWCANEAGIPADVIPRRALVAYMKDAFEKMGRYYAWTKSKCGGGKQDIRPGDLILFSTAPLGRLNHIGLVQNVTYKNGQVTIKTVEGNKGDQCCMKTYTLSTSSLTGYVTNEKVYIRGFACPAYNN